MYPSNEPETAADAVADAPETSETAEAVSDASDDAGAVADADPAE